MKMVLNPKMIVAAVLVLAVLSSAIVVAGASSTVAGVKAANQAATNVKTVLQTGQFDLDTPLPLEVPVEVEKLKAQLPKTLLDAEARVLPVRGRFLMYTRDLQHIMWGRFSGQFFVGTDNLGKTAWGIYGQGYFAGFYDGDFFWGRYSNGYWKAQGLFGLNFASGRYVTYPMWPTPATSVIQP